MYQAQENGQKPNWGIGSTPGGALSGPVHPWSDLKNYFQHFDQYYLLDIMIACLNMYNQPKAMLFGREIAYRSHFRPFFDP